jgi:hypothetical protein
MKRAFTWRIDLCIRKNLMDRKRVVRLVGLIIVVCLVGTAVTIIVSRLFFGTVLNKPATVEMQLNAPEQVTLNEPFVVTLQLTNVFTGSQTLHSIDLDNDYLENIRLDSSNPEFGGVRPLPLTGFASYSFDWLLPPRRTSTIELRFVPEKAGQFFGLIDVCLDDGTLCQALPLETEVVE